jgi:hypothetical protein
MKPLLATDPPAVGGFALLGRLGAGGMGQVYLGVTRSGRPVAVKMIKSEIAAEQAFRGRFVREVAAAQRVGGFWTASVVAADPEADTPWLATEYVPGPSLKQAVEQVGPVPAAAVRVMAARLAEALAAIHAAGLVHRDLKPANVLLAPDGPKVIDFGIARAFQTETAGLTSQLGTPSYMAPEQVRGERLSPATDVFSLASTLVYALVGRGPFHNGAPEGVIFRVATGDPDLTGVPAELSTLIAACLDKEPGRRPTTGQLLAVLGLAAAAVSPYAGWQPPAHDPAAALAHTVELSGGGSVARPVPRLPPPVPPGQDPAPAPPAVPPSRRVAPYLAPAERVRGEWRQHPVRLWQYLGAGLGAATLLGLLAGFAGAFLAAWFAAVPIVLGMVVLGWTGWAIAAWRVRRFAVTDQRALLIGGPFARRLAALPLPQVAACRFRQPVLGRLLGYGTLVLDGAGRDHPLREVPFLPRSERILDALGATPGRR